MVSMTFYGKDKLFIDKETIQSAKEQLVKLYGESDRIDIGLAALSEQWVKTDGDNGEFIKFAVDNFVSDPIQLDQLSKVISDNIRVINGHIWKIGSTLSNPYSANTGKIKKYEELFAGVSINVDINKELYRSKVAHLVLLNFPPVTDEQKKKNGHTWSYQQWGYVFLGDMFKVEKSNKESKRSKGNKDISKKLYKGDSQRYADNSVIPIFTLCDANGNRVFTENKNLLLHWKMRDEIKNLYGSSLSDKLVKQKTIYSAMRRYIDQSIPQQIFSQDTSLKWDPNTNILLSNGGETLQAESNNNLRYEYLRNLFLKQYNRQPDSTKYFDNYFKAYNVKASDIENMFVEILSSKEAIQVGKLIKKKIGRDLEPFDVWYTGFNNRSSYDSDSLDNYFKTIYPTPQALTDSIPSLLMKLGFDRERADFYGSKICVEPARANGHAEGAVLKNEKSFLRTNFTDNGLDFGGFQTAMHELGHSVQQTISAQLIDIFPMSSLPNSGLVESAAYLFEFKTWNVIDGLNVDKEGLYNNSILDNFWATYEIAGPALCEMKMWQWMYNKKVFSADELRNATISIAKEVWNSYYAPVFGISDEIMPAVYNHMLNSSLYLSGYTLAHIIHMQIENYLAGKDFPSEVERIYKLGEIPFDIWMERALQSSLSAKPILNITSKALSNINN